MTGRQRAVAVVVLVLAAVATFIVYAVNRRERIERASPAWLDPHQPPDGVAGELTTLTAGESWAANRCRPLAASCSAHTAGRRVRRIYDPTLEQSSGSYVRTALQIEGRCC